MYVIFVSNKMKLINFNFNKSDKIIFVSIFSISLLLFLFYVNLNAFDNFYDQEGYVTISNEFLEQGLFEAKSEIQEIRTYLYPAIIASIKIFNNDDVITKIILSVIQYAVYLFTVIFIANYATSFLKSKPKSENFP